MIKFTSIALLSLLTLTACNASPVTSRVLETPNANSESMSEVPDLVNGQKPESPSFKANYIPENWKQEEGLENFFYSPEMWSVREGGPYSLYISINQNSTSIQDYLTQYYSAFDAGCLKDKKEFILNERPALSYSSTCGNIPFKVTLMEIDGFLVEGTSYSFSDETQEINKILSSLVLTTK